MPHTIVADSCGSINAVRGAAFNALKFTGGELLWLASQTRRCVSTFTVWDTGIGISAKSRLSVSTAIPRANIVAGRQEGALV